MLTQRSIGLTIVGLCLVIAPQGPLTTTTTIEGWIERDGVKVAERFVQKGDNQPTVPMRIVDVEFNKVNPKVVSLPESLRKQVEQLRP